MNKQEIELEKLVNEVDATNVSVPPLFELYTTVFSIALSIMLFSYPDMIDASTRLYYYMTMIMPQTAWAFSFFAASMFKAIGLLWDKNFMRITGLSLSVVMYAFLTFCNIFSFPSIGSITFSLMAIFAGLSIPFVKHTSIKYRR